MPPGQHTISSDKEGSRIFAGKRENSLIIDAKEGEASYVKLKVVMGAWHGVGEVQQVPPETGKTGTASLVRRSRTGPGPERLGWTGILSRRQSTSMELGMGATGENLSLIRPRAAER